MAKSGRAPLGPNRPDMSPIRKPRAAWECRECHYKPMPAKATNCYNCGRDFWGNPGTIPQDATRDGT